MKTRKLGWTDLELTVTGLGTWAMGGGDWAFAWGPQDDRQSSAGIRRALELGVNWVDTAPAYGLGHAEEVLGDALKDLPTRPIIATKCGRSWDANRRIFPSLKKDVIRTEVEASLRRLKIDGIDLFQIHWPQPDEDVEEAWSAIAALVQEGKIRYAGVCNFNVAQLRRIQPIHPVASLQPPYSMLERTVEQDLLTFCARHNIGVVAYSPMQKGLLTGKMTRERVAQFPADDHRRHDPHFQEPRLGAHLQLIERLRPIAEKNRMSLAQLAVGWVLRRPELTSAIVGVRSPGQAEDTMNRDEFQIPAEDLERIEELLIEFAPVANG